MPSTSVWESVSVLVLGWESALASESELGWESESALALAWEWESVSVLGSA